MKRVLAFLLVLVMLATLFVACNDDENDPCAIHNDADSDGVCDNCGTEVTVPCTKHTDMNLDGKCDTCSAAVTAEINDAVGLAMVNAVKAQFTAAKSMMAEFTILMSATENGVAVDGENGSATFTVTLARTEKGFNAKVDALVKSVDATGKETTDFNGTMFYFVDGVLYALDIEYDVFEIVMDLGQLEDTAAGGEKSSMMQEMLGMLSGMLEDMAPTLSEDDLAELGKAFLTTFSVANNKGSIKLDAKPVFDSFKAYVTGLDFNTKTLESLLNDALALVDETLTVEAILDAVEGIAKMTVAEALAAIDTFLTENYQTTLQGVYDQVIATEQAKKLIALILDVNDSELTFDELYAEIVALKIADLIPTEMKSMTLYDVVVMFLSSSRGEMAPDEEPYTEGEGDAPAIPTIEQLREMVDQMLDMTLAQMDEMLELPILSQIQMIVDAITLHACNATADVAFKGLFLVDTVTLSVNVDVELKALFSEETAPAAEETAHFKINLTLKIYDISAEAKTITAPTNVVRNG